MKNGWKIAGFLFFLLIAVLVFGLSETSAQGSDTYTLPPIVGALPGWGVPIGVIITHSYDKNYHIIQPPNGGVIDTFPVGATIFTGYPDPKHPLAGTAHGFRYPEPGNADPPIDSVTGLFVMPKAMVNDYVFHVLSVPGADATDTDHWIQLFHDPATHEAFVYVYMNLVQTTGKDKYGVPHTGQHQIYAYDVSYHVEAPYVALGTPSPAPGKDYPWPDEFLPLPAFDG